MKTGHKPNILRIIEEMEAEEMLSDVFVHSESGAAAKAYDSLINGTIREVQELCEFEKDLTLSENDLTLSENDLTLSMHDARIQYTVYWHLGLLCDHLTESEQKSQWVQERDRCLSTWRSLVKSKGYPITFTEKFEQCGESEKDQVKELLEDNGSEKPPAVAWNLRFLCDSLPKGPEKLMWELKLSNYLELISEQQRSEADDYAQRVNKFIKEFNEDERELSPDKYYEEVVPEGVRSNRSEKQKEIVGKVSNFFNKQR
jgi:hypothetical protein